MTAEIAIINRAAVTLAADSAVTLTVRNSEKVYNSADKLFELSNHDPIGVMIYNNLEFMGLTLEVAVKHFRDHVATENFATVFDAADAFFEYLARDLKGDRALQRQHARSILLPEMRQLWEEWQSAISEEYVKLKQRTDFPGILTHKIADRQDHFSSLETAQGFEDVSDEEIQELYGELFEEVRNTYFSDQGLSLCVRWYNL